MAEKKFCDKCSKEITETEQYQLYIYKVRSDREIVNIDLCPSCYTKVRKAADI